MRGLLGVDWGLLQFGFEAVGELVFEIQARGSVCAHRPVLASMRGVKPDRGVWPNADRRVLTCGCCPASAALRVLSCECCPATAKP